MSWLDVGQTGNNIAMKVLVCGGGIAGLTTALFLVEEGFVCEVFEAKEDRPTTTSGINLSPSGTNVLAELGLDVPLTCKAQPVRHMRMLNSKGDLLAELDFKGKEQYGQDYLAMTRRDLHEVLLGKAREMGVAIHYNTRLVSSSQDEQGVVARFDNGIEARGDILIGADGIHSAVRHSVFQELQLGEKQNRGYFGCGAIIPLSYLTPEEISFLRLMEGGFNSFTGTLGFVGFIGVGQGKFMFWSHIADANVPAGFDPTNLTQVKDVMLSLRGSWCSPIRKTIELLDQNKPDIEAMCHAIHSLRPIPTWSNKRIVLIGDAAHGFGPGAQGAAMAMEDALLLVRMIATCKDDNRTEAWAEVFRRFEAKRRPRVEKIGVASEARNDARLVEKSVFVTTLNEYAMRLLGWWYRNGYYDPNIAYRVEHDL